VVNFVFNEGASASISGDIDWLGVSWECALYDDTVAPDQTSVWADISAGVVATGLYVQKVITTSGAAGADPIQFTDVSPTQPDGRLPGFVIKRQSDNLLLVHIDEGFDGLSRETTQVTQIMNVQLADATYTFTLKPGLNNESAWFRL